MYTEAELNGLPTHPPRPHPRLLVSSLRPPPNQLMGRPNTKPLRLVLGAGEEIPFQLSRVPPNRDNNQAITPLLDPLHWAMVVVEARIPLVGPLHQAAAVVEAKCPPLHQAAVMGEAKCPLVGPLHQAATVGKARIPLVGNLHGAAPGDVAGRST